MGMHPVNRLVYPSISSSRFFYSINSSYRTTLPQFPQYILRSPSFYSNTPDTFQKQSFSTFTSKMSEITHPTIKDGWFREISDMWPGQAMTLKVKNVIHHEKSKYQDVLIFESTDYGNHWTDDCYDTMMVMNAGCGWLMIQKF